jgi:hypothetical protein
MLNLEYARLVDADRRRVAEERIRTDRLLHPDQAPVDIAPVTATVNRRPQATCRGVPGPAR